MKTKLPIIISRKSFICCYATSANDHHKRLDLHDWPTTKNPTPFEIFNISTKEMTLSQLELNRIIKRKYISFVKLYHPDTSHELNISEDIKRKRFDLIQDSYEILKNPRRRFAYNRSQTTNFQNTPYTRNAQDNFQNFRRAHAQNKRFNFENDEAFWQAGTWNDYYQMKYKRPPPTKEELEKNKYKILIGVLLVGAISFGLQFMNAIEKTNQYLLETHKLNLKSMKDLNQSYENYGEGLTDADNLKRFLLSRRSTIKSKQRDENEQKIQEPDDHDLLVKFAKKRVNRWDRDEAANTNLDIE
ncbi:unnamed protein product [Candida verbasci]|uniref:J domain-containing protein n=1 Tax=Candida verbasci TaxID=1227364 RepID=A0A9W4TTP6_9ASCO|nr:unnamed protein product [Candida verbasci]